MKKLMRKVLVVSWYFAPCSRMGAKRFGIMCKYFEENGYEPYVIAAPASITGNGAAAELEIPIPRNHLTEVNIDKSNMYFTAAILEVFKLMKLCSRTVESSQFWYKNVKRSINLEELRSINFDIVIGTYGPMVNLYIAKYLSRKLKCKYIADIRDPISDYDEKLPQGYRWTSKLDYVIEKMFLNAAEGITTVNLKMKEDMKARYPKKKVITVYNGWDGEERLYYQAEKYLYFAGTLYEYSINGLTIVLKALKVVNEKEDIKMIIRCIGSQASKVKQIIREMKMQNIVSCLPPVGERIVREERQKSFINVVFCSIDKEDYDMVTIPGKAYEYMHERAPVLAVTPDTSIMAKALRYTNKGIGTTVESKIVDFILNAGGKYKGNDNVLKFSRQYQTARLCRFMDYILEH